MFAWRIQSLCGTKSENYRRQAESINRPVQLTCHQPRIKLGYEVIEASLAQLVEQRFRKAWVAGSSPATGSISNRMYGNGLEPPDWPLSVKVSVNWCEVQQLTHNSTKLR
jgi:hypothetical protein